eukprot:TRINITY_DN9112_c0_g1_i1.p1 TRINITY_DN9112_c0_g1~~TRINITY_DN9112_c0_g1_i1.p1  ORF type:complete len:420 (+),score=55.89 TRINITY_DN9112_c0_g1_i1:52-1311(+)
MSDDYDDEFEDFEGQETAVGPQETIPPGDSTPEAAQENATADDLDPDSDPPIVDIEACNPLVIITEEDHHERSENDAELPEVPVAADIPELAPPVDPADDSETEREDDADLRQTLQSLANTKPREPPPVLKINAAVQHHSESRATATQTLVAHYSVAVQTEIPTPSTEPPTIGNPTAPQKTYSVAGVLEGTRDDDLERLESALVAELQAVRKVLRARRLASVAKRTPGRPLPTATEMASVNSACFAELPKPEEAAAELPVLGESPTRRLSQDYTLSVDGSSSPDRVICGSILLTEEPPSGTEPDPASKPASPVVPPSTPPDAPVASQMAKPPGTGPAKAQRTRAAFSAWPPAPPLPVQPRPAALYCSRFRDVPSTSQIPKRPGGQPPTRRAWATTRPVGASFLRHSADDNVAYSVITYT